MNRHLQYLETQIVVQPGGGVLLDDETQMFGGLHERFAARLRGFREVLFCLI
jgi:hypothetical protein